MRAIRARDTKPELKVRQALRAAGYAGYRLHRRDLPGRPDIVFPGRRKLIFVHGCFWHGHECKEGVRRPKSRADYWLPKISGNQERDVRNREILRASGWDVMTVWECETADPRLQQRLGEFLRHGTCGGCTDEA
jgi:DNA mismatch endonuclease (patch repair protein)